MAPEDVSSAKGRIWLSQSGTMVAQNTSDTMTQMARLCGAPKDEYVPNYRSFETQNQAGSDDAGASSIVPLALSEMAQTAPPSALLSRFAH
jgi:hypothetical protein